MATPNERKALWFLALVALSGSGVRLWRATRPMPDASAAVALDRQLQRVDSARLRPRGRAPGTKTPPTRGSPPPSGPVDLDRADSAAIEALPGIGPALASRIVAYRDSAGSFGDVEALCDVRGVGPALVKRLRPLVTFTGPRRPLSDACGRASNQARKTSAARSRKRP